MKFFTIQEISPNQRMTPEGFLLCEGVPIARVGEMTYGAGEIPVTPSIDGRIIINRDEDEVFRPETIASFNGKDVVDDHPPDDVTSQNFRIVSAGVTLNPRRGAGDFREFLLADLLIKDRDMIDSIRAGKREVSCGYDADYEELEPGRGRQKNIIGNHVALVERGRCGHQCSIRDKEGDTMARTLDHGTPDRIKTFFDSLRKAFDTKDKVTFDKTAEEMEHEIKDNAMHGVHLHLGHTAEHHNIHHPGHHRMGDDEEPPGWFKKHAEDCDKRFKDIHEMFGKIAHHDAEEKEEEKKRKVAEDAENREIEGKLRIEAPPGTGDKAAKAKDSAYLADSFQETVALAEILVPGIGVATYDSAASPAKTYDAICKMRRDALELGMVDVATRAIINQVIGGKTMDFRSQDVTCDQVRSVFIAAANCKRTANNSRLTVTNGVVGKPRVNAGFVGASPSDINRMNAERFKKTA
jgi:uncharacterized protein